MFEILRVGIIFSDDQGGSLFSGFQSLTDGPDSLEVRWKVNQLNSGKHFGSGFGDVDEIRWD